MDPFTPGPTYEELVVEKLGPGWRMTAPANLTASDGTPIPAGSTLTAAEAIDAGVQIIMEVSS